MPTPVALWRRGNATSPRMDNVRPQDVDIYTQDGVDYVQELSGGISTYAYSAKPTDKNWWSLPGGAEIPEELTLTMDLTTPGHWLWEPSTNMTLSAYKAALRVVQPWIGPTKAPEEMVVMHGPLSMTAPNMVPESPMKLEPKSHRFLLAALDQQIWSMRRSLEDPSLSEDDQSDLSNDLALYELMRKGFADRGSARIAGGPEIRGQAVILGQTEEEASE